MGYYKTGIEFLKDFPFGLIPELLGMDNPDDAKMKKKYNDAMKIYRLEYQKAINIGITEADLKILGVERPQLGLQSSGMGGGGGGIPFLPFLPPPPKLPPPTQDEINQVEMKIRAIENAEENKNNPPEPQPINEIILTQSTTFTPPSPSEQSRLDEILDKYKENAGEISDADWTEVQRIMDFETQGAPKNTQDINADTPLEDDLEEEIEKIMTNSRGVSTGVPSSVTLKIIENLLAESTKGTVRLNKPTAEQLKKEKAFKLNGETREFKIATRGRDIVRRLWKDNPKLWQDILDILVKYGRVKKSDLSFKTRDYDSINELSNNILNNTGIDSEILNRELMKRLKLEATQRNAPQWYIDIFDDTPIDVRVENPPMSPSIKDDTIHRVLVRTMRQQLINLGIPEFDAQEMSLRLIEHFQSQELGNISEAGDYTEGVNMTINVLLDEFNSIIQEATQRLTGPFTVNKQQLIKLMKSAFNTYFQEKDEKLTFLQKVQVFRDLINQVVTIVNRDSSSSSSGGGFQPISISPNELAQEIKNDEKMDVIRGRGIRIRNSGQKINIQDRPTSNDIDFLRRIFQDDDDDDESSDEPEDPDIPIYNGPGQDWRNPFEDFEDIPLGDPPAPPGGDPPPDPPRGNMVDFFYRGAWRRISLKTLIKALIIAGSTTGTIYAIYNRLSRQEEYNGDDDEFEKNNEEKNKNDTIDDKEKMAPSADKELEDLRKTYLQLIQYYADARKRGADTNELRNIWKKAKDVEGRINKLKQSIIIDDKDNEEEPVEPSGEGEMPIVPGGEGEMPIAPGGEGDIKFAPGDEDDEHTMVTFDEDHEQDFSPDFKDPAEANLFLSTTKEAQEEKRRWEQYSLVRPGFGLGNINQNPLAMHNYKEEKKRFTDCFKSEKPGKAPTKQAIDKRSNPQNQPFWIPAIMNEYGEVQFEDSFYNEKMSQAFTNPVPVDNKQRTFENSNSIYFPENSLATHKQKGVRIPELRNFGGYYGVNRAPSTQGGFSNNRKVFDDMYKFTPQMPNDYKHNKSDVSNNVSYSLPKNGSARF